VGAHHQHGEHARAGGERSFCFASAAAAAADDDDDDGEVEALFKELFVNEDPSNQPSPRHLPTRAHTTQPSMVWPASPRLWHWS